VRGEEKEGRRREEMDEREGERREGRRLRRMKKGRGT
jgi:hypothetical protein